ncbi:hypothetical protein B7494_g6621 [Chlorociboria aeruginascens]|nr:hypothetical protein B7494_g6621 [Chlorociboria aeruginascens]
MKDVLISVLVAAFFGSSALAAPPQCLIVCEEPDHNDPFAASSCNCAERYCPSGPEVPSGKVWGWNAETNTCGAVLPGDQCAGLDVSCTGGYVYGWNGVDTCQCLPEYTKREPIQPVCAFECFTPAEHDPNAIPTDCNCEKEYCAPNIGPGGPNIPLGDVWAFNATSNACGAVSDPQAQCASRGVECVSGYSYGWSASDSACECLPYDFEKRTIGPVCDIECLPPMRYDSHSESVTCNCAERYCPYPQGPGGPNIPVGDVWAFNAASNACGAVPDPQAECASLNVECLSGYAYGWSAVDSACECLPDYS